MKRIKETATVAVAVTALIVACGGAETLNLWQTVIGLAVMIGVPWAASRRGWISPEDMR